MRWIFVAFSCIVFAQSALASTYQFARQCKSNTEPCFRMGCRHNGVTTFGTFPFSVLYTCCQGNVIDQKNHVCASINGVISTKSCNPCTEFRCGNGQCTLRSWKCNGFKECKDGTDELGCGLCTSAQFRCSNARCVERSRVCDKVNDCGDGTDETGCVRRDGTSCGVARFRCANDRCIPQRYVCDNDNDCADGSDELNCPTKLGKKRNEILKKHEELNDDTGKGKGKPKDAEADTMTS